MLILLVLKDTDISWEPVCVEAIVGLCLSSVVCNRQQQIARGCLPGMAQSARMLGGGYFGGWWKSQIIPVKKAGNNAAWGFVSPCFQRHLFFDKVPETVSDMLLGTYGKEYTFYQLCFPYPLVAFAGCGNRQHFGHCCSEIAFTDQSTRNGLHSAWGTRGPTLQNCTQGWTMYTIFGLDTKNQGKILL